MPPLTLDQCLVRFLAIFGCHTWPLYGVPWRKKSGRILVHDPVTKLFHSNVQSSRGDYSHTRGATIHGSPRSDQLKMARRASYNKTQTPTCPPPSFPSRSARPTRSSLSNGNSKISRGILRHSEIYYLVSSEDSGSPLLEIPRFLKEERWSVYISWIHKNCIQRRLLLLNLFELIATATRVFRFYGIASWKEKEMDETCIHSGSIKIVFKGDYYWWKYRQFIRINCNSNEYSDLVEIRGFYGIAFRKKACSRISYKNYIQRWLLSTKIARNIGEFIWINCAERVQGEIGEAKIPHARPCTRSMRARYFVHGT